MYEIWLLLNIVFEVALTVWPMLVAALLFWLALLWGAGQRLRAHTLMGSLALGGAAVLVAALVLPALTRSSLNDMSYWLDWAALAGLSLACGAVVAAFALPVLSLLRRTH